MRTRVLIAEPDRYLAADYARGLIQRGFAAATASDGLECLQLLRSFRPDVLVLEPAVPWGGGDGIVTVMHEDPGIAPVPVILLTHGCDGRTLYNLAPFPIEDYRRKPMSCDALAECIRRIIRGKGRTSNRGTSGGLPCTTLEIHS